MNPKHKVPVLLIDGEPLTENVAIQLFIARRFRMHDCFRQIRRRS